jgi:hypothetical protein
VLRDGKQIEVIVGWLFVAGAREQIATAAPWLLCHHQLQTVMCWSCWLHGAAVVLDRCDKVLQLHIIKKGCKPAATQGNASARAAAFMAANTAAAGPRSKAGPLAAAAGAAAASAAAQRQQQQSRSGVTANTPQSQSGSRAADDEGESGDAAGAGQLLVDVS